MAKTGANISQGIRHSTGSYELVFSAAVLALIGLGLDTLLGLRPVLTVTFAILGVVGAIASIYFRYREAMKNQSRPR